MPIFKIRIFFFENLQLSQKGPLSPFRKLNPLKKSFDYEKCSRVESEFLFLELWLRKLGKGQVVGQFVMFFEK